MEPGGAACPNCSAENPAAAPFCEACGYDYSTGLLPRPETGRRYDPGLPAPEAGDPTPAEAGTAPAGDAGPGLADDPAAADPTVDDADRLAGTDANPRWVVELTIDPEWYGLQESPDPIPAVAEPEVIALPRTRALIGRPSASLRVRPEIDCEPDSWVSRSQAELTTDGERWWIEDLDSANGTFLSPEGGPLPEDPIPPRTRIELPAGVRIYLGAWTRLVLRPAAPGEVRGR